MGDKFWTLAIVALFIISEVRHAWSVRTWAKALSESNKDWFDYCRRRIDRDTE